MKKCYIYAIKNISNNKRYVGSSINILTRLRVHFQQLRDDKHPNEKLQRSFNKHGKDKFISEILEEFDHIDNEHRFRKEQHYIDFYKVYKNGYNCTSNADFNGANIDWTKEKLKRMGESVSKALKGKIPKNYEEMTKKSWKPVYEIRDGIIVNEYPSVKAAGDALGIKYKSIHDRLRRKKQRELNKIGKVKLRLPNLKNRTEPNLEWQYKEKGVDNE